MILFNKQFKEKILSGEKTTTMRKANNFGLWIQKTNFTNNWQNVSICVKDIKKVYISDINEEMALSDWFDNLSQCIQYIRNYTKGDFIWLYNFSLIW